MSDKDGSANTKPKEEEYVMCVWKKSNRQNGLTISGWKGINETFRKGVPVKVTIKEKELLEERRPGCFTFKTIKEYKSLLEAEKKKKEKADKK